MKLLILAMMFLSSQLYASEQVKVPSKCLTKNKRGKIKEKTCQPFNPQLGKSVGGVCVFDRGWKYGTWKASKTGTKRFKKKYLYKD